MVKPLRNSISLSILLSLFLLQKTSAQLTVTPGLSAMDLAMILVDTSSAAISSPVCNCALTGRGSFTATPGVGLGISSGVVLTTGTAMASKGPNTTPGMGSDNFFPGDAGLTAWAGRPTNNACILEFDITPLFDTLYVTYSFGSEEYLEFVGAYNDVFGFFLSGPGIPGVVNFAYVPGTVLPVCVNNINNLVNSVYYVDNPPGAPHIQYDGYTKPLQAKIPLVIGGTYHLRLGVADAVDGIYDTGVFVAAKSITSKLPSAVPVGLLSFKVEQAKTSNIIRWKTASEKSSASYTVEKSADGKLFTAVGSKPSAGNSNDVTEYIMVDNNPAGAKYYRLKQADLNGKETVLNLITLDVPVAAHTNIFPSPLLLGQDLIVQSILSEKGTISVLVYDSFGKLVASETKACLEGPNELGIKTAGLEKGQYFVQVLSDGELTTKKIMIY
jgi:hypothetical protein